MNGTVVDPAPDRVDTALVWNGERYFHVAGVGYNILRLLQVGPLLPSELQDRLRQDDCFSPAEHLAAVVKRLEELQVVTFQNACKPIAAKKSLLSRLFKVRDGDTHQYLSIRLRIFSPQAVTRLCRPLSILCGPTPLRLVLPLLLIFQSVFCWKWSVGVLAAVRHASASELLVVVVLNYGFLLFHECGHAAACISESVPPGEIGAGLYLYMPVFYTDVSSAWRIPRSRRLVIDASGMYFSLLASTVASLLFLCTKDSLWGVLAIATDLATLANLNPAIRMDAYWLMSDWLGIDNLMQMNKRTARALVFRSRGRQTTTLGRKEIDGWKLGVYRVYFATVIAFSIYTVACFAYIGIPFEMRYVFHQAPLLFSEAQGLPKGGQEFVLGVFKSVLVSIPLLAAVWMMIGAVLRRIVPGR